MEAEEARARLSRERAFHDAQPAAIRRPSTARFYEVSAGLARYRQVLDELPAGARVLEVGCGRGGVALRLVRQGLGVTAIDASQVTVARVQRRARRLGLPVHAAEMDGQALGFPDACFDAVCGSGVLHHLDLDRAYAEIARVLRPGGRAVFFEPLGHNPAVNLYRRRTPHLRSPDEHPLELADIERARRWFADVHVEHHDLTVLALGATGRHAPRAAAALHAVDRFVLAWIPPLRRWSWTVVLRLAAPRRGATTPVA